MTSQTVHRYLLLSLALAGGVLGCKKKSEAPSTPTPADASPADAPLEAQTALTTAMADMLAALPTELRTELEKVLGCPTSNCGNAAKLGNEYLGALSTAGEADLVGAKFTLVRGSLQVPAGPCKGMEGLSIGVDRGDLVGVDDAGNTKCRGTQLVKGRFELANGASRYVVVVHERGETRTWEERPKKLPTYRFRYMVPGAADASAKDVCPIEAPWNDKLGGLHVSIKQVPTNHAVLVQGETYGTDAGITQQDAKWFHIACAGSAIAKMRLLGFDPMRTKGASWSLPAGPDTATESTNGERQATLKMLSSKYCRDRGWTLPDTPIYAFRPGQSVPLPDSAASAINAIESRWDENGATCLSHWRLARQKYDVSETAEALVWALIKLDCPHLEACPGDDGVRCEPSSAADHVWTTCTSDHITHSPPSGN